MQKIKAFSLLLYFHCPLVFWQIDRWLQFVYRNIRKNMKYILRLLKFILWSRVKYVFKFSCQNWNGKSKRRFASGMWHSHPPQEKILINIAYVLEKTSFLQFYFASKQTPDCIISGGGHCSLLCCACNSSKPDPSCRAHSKTWSSSGLLFS